MYEIAVDPECLLLIKRGEDYYNIVAAFVGPKTSDQWELARELRDVLNGGGSALVEAEAVEAGYTECPSFERHIISDGGIRYCENPDCPWVDEQRVKDEPRLDGEAWTPATEAKAVDDTAGTSGW